LATEYSSVPPAMKRLPSAVNEWPEQNSVSELYQ
jgi:hypothetical protein